MRHIRTRLYKPNTHSNPMIIYRPAEINDLKTLRKIEQQVVLAERPFNAEIKTGAPLYYDIENLIASDDTFMLIGESADEIIATGYAQIIVSKGSLQHRKHAYLGFMYVAESYRGQGLNGKIIEKLNTWCLEQGIRDCYLDVYSANAQAIRAYEKLGFESSMIKMKVKLKPSEETQSA